MKGLWGKIRDRVFRPRRANVIRITPLGRNGNRMFQYMMAVALRSRSGVPATICGLSLPEFGIFSPKEPAQESPVVEIAHHGFPFTALAEEMRHSHREIHIQMACLRMCYYAPHLEEYRALFRPVRPLGEGFDGTHLVMHIRAADVLNGGHPEYLVVPVSWYARLLEETGLRPVFVGQLGDDAHTQALRAKFPGAVFQQSEAWEEDFHILRTSVNVVVSNGSFAWLAAWLSSTTRRIFLPVMGLSHPACRPDIDLLPLEDPRYEFHVFDLLNWGADPVETQRRIIEDDIPSRKMSAAEIRAAFPATLGTEGVGIKSPWRR